MKLREVLGYLNELVKVYPQSLEMEAINYSETNEWYKVWEVPTLCQVEDITGSDFEPLEMVGTYFEEGDGIALEDCNAICIN
jgi:hypothetical protein